MALDVAPAVARWLGRHFNWSDEQVAADLIAYEDAVEQMAAASAHAVIERDDGRNFIRGRITAGES